MCPFYLVILHLSTELYDFLSSYRESGSGLALCSSRIKCNYLTVTTGANSYFKNPVVKQNNLNFL